MLTKKSAIPCQASLIQSTNAAQICRPVSVCVKNQASAATAAAIHPTIGIAEIAAVADAANPVIAV